MLGPDATHLFHLHYFVLFSSSPLFTPLLEALGPRSRLIHGTQTLPWLDKKNLIEAVETLK